MKLLKISAFVLILGLWSCGQDKYKNLDDGIYADIQTSAGDILVQLEYKDVPKTVGSFVSLANGTNPRVIDSMKGVPFYDGLNFHRVMSKSNGGKNDFMIQGGCPLGNGRGDPGYKFGDEFPLDSTGGLLLKHDSPGVLSMANSGPGTNGSQFFIMLVPYPSLDGRHAVFGHVVEGQDIVDNQVKTNTDIIKIDIIRVGSDAKNFDAPAAINAEFKRGDDIKAAFLEKMDEYKSNAEELPSGLKFYFIKKGDGSKPAIDSDIQIHYSAFFTNGVLLDTNRKEIAQEYGIYSAPHDRQRGYEPFPAKYSMKGDLVHGFKEGMLQMNIGDQIVLFMPSHLAYGEQGNRGVPPDTDLIFELELYSKAE